jgi:hypothetical protein
MAHVINRSEIYAKKAAWHGVPDVELPNIEVKADWSVPREYVGFVPLHEIHIKQGDTVKIRKGTVLESRTHPTRKSFVARRDYKVKVRYILSGTTENGVPTSNPQIGWAGSGGYWVTADINKVQKV